MMNKLEEPKRPMTSFFIFMNEHREQIKLDHPGIKFTDIGKRASEMWKALDDKTEWQEKAIDAKRRYAELISEFESNGGTKKSLKRKRPVEEEKKPPKKSKKSKVPSDDSDEDSD